MGAKRETAVMTASRKEAGCERAGLPSCRIFGSSHECQAWSW